MVAAGRHSMVPGLCLQSVQRSAQHGRSKELCWTRCRMAHARGRYLASTSAASLWRSTETIFLEVSCDDLRGNLSRCEHDVRGLLELSGFLEVRHVSFNLNPPLLPHVLVHPRHPKRLVLLLRRPVALLLVPHLPGLAASLLRLLAPFCLLLVPHSRGGHLGLGDLARTLARILDQFETLQELVPLRLHFLLPALQALLAALLLILHALLSVLNVLGLQGLRSLKHVVVRRLPLPCVRFPGGPRLIVAHLHTLRLLLVARSLLLLERILLLSILRLALLHKGPLTLLLLRVLYHIADLLLKHLPVKPGAAGGGVGVVAGRQFRQHNALLQDRCQESCTALYA
mmetsp:Transcript_102978/g.266282  ORF Transcript_102978/g.266282 Transcript_102978/m.266282 type:complete len:342 (-) Transcript_102978:578-1603(-)